jgi:hypothetical protein
MPKRKPKLAVAATDGRPLGGANSWARSPGTYIAGQANIDGADRVAVEMERRWGCDRLRLLVDVPLREKFDRQRYLFNQAIWHGDLEAVRREATRMTKAWRALDSAAAAAGELPLADEHWEVRLEDGSVAILVRDAVQVSRVRASGRAVAVYTVAEVAKLLMAFPTIAEAKRIIPGCEVIDIRDTIDDPLHEIIDTAAELDDPAATEETW